MATQEFIPRTAEVGRKTKETDVSVHLNLDGAGHFSNQTGIGFLDHMLDLFAKHGGFDLDVTCNGDLSSRKDESGRSRWLRSCRG